MGYPSFDLSGRVAIVTGGGTGIGKGMAMALAAQGADVVVASRNPSHLADTVSGIEALGRRGLAIPTDVREVSQIYRMVDETIKVFGQIDILVTNSGVNRRILAVDIKEEDWHFIVDTNLKGTFFCCQAVAKQMIPRRKGKIITIGSLTAFMGYPKVGPYAASRGGIVQLTKVLAVEWAPYHINVNTISPGWYDTPLTHPLFEDPEWVTRTCHRIPLERTGTPEDLGGAVVFLASEASDYITGEMIFVDGGMKAGYDLWQY
ncbi:MAG: glucose 1-dehydrogenase [candidate division NC10 bacterium]|nr:glucose 1-dehydrogenase [candidate division NC10 bacterium]